MKLLSLNEAAIQGSGRIYRQGRFMALISTLILGGSFGGAPILWWYLGAPWPVWAICAAVAMFVVPLVLSDLAAKFRRTNWLLWVRPNGVWINLRSYQDQSPGDHPNVLALDYVDITRVRKHTERFTTPGSDHRSMHYSVHSLEIELRNDNTEAVALAIAENRRRQQPQRRYLGMGVTSRPCHFPVTVQQPRCIRIAWRGGIGNWVAPSLRHVLRELALYTRVAEPEVQRRADWSNLSDAELDDMIFKLVQNGNSLDAVNLLVIRRGYTRTAARQFVDGLLAATAV
jgi:hypothetical protein